MKLPDNYRSNMFTTRLPYLGSDSPREATLLWGLSPYPSVKQ